MVPGISVLTGGRLWNWHNEAEADRLAKSSSPPPGGVPNRRWDGP
jgi:hypothetical protein